MNRIKPYISAIILLALLFTACENHDDSPSPGGNAGEFAENFGNEVSRDFFGQIVDINDNPIQNVTVRIGSATAQTDENGVFMINNAPVHERFAYITASKIGFIDGSRSIIPTTGKNNIKIMMIPSSSTMVSSGQPSEITLDNGTKVVFDGAFENEDGSSYSGDVLVSAFYLSARDENLQDLMPGMLYAQDQNGEEAMLVTYGMMHVELRAPSGAKLQIAEGHSAELTMRIANEQLASAPSTIPLWYFDEELGYWKEEGFATKQGNFYVGDVTHFSWWNCDAPFPTVTLTTTIFDSEGNPVTNAQIGLLTTLSPYERVGFSNSNGQISGLVPSNQVMTMNVYDNCGNLISASQIGPFAADTVLPAINLSSAVNAVLVEGTLLSCSNTNVTNGYVQLNYEGESFFTTVSDGHFSFSTLACSSATAFSLTGADYDNLQVTDLINYTYSAPVTNVGNIVACSNVMQFISYQIDSDPPAVCLIELGGTLGSTTQPGLAVFGYFEGQGDIYIYSNITAPGTYTTANFAIEGNGIGYIGPSTPNDIIFIVSNIGAVGEYIDMTFNGTYNDDGVTRTITGTAHVVRNQ
ncbi:MAG TPA: carboxypeptidase-like regulatory domain-containing protein [Flavobacterium sp.]|jgi:hypothetical protein